MWIKETYTNATGQDVTVLTASSNVKLVSVAKNPLTRDNGKSWYPATGSWTDQKGVKRQPRVIINGGNYAYGMETGIEYVTKLVFVPETNSVLFIMSHLVRGEEGDSTWFDFGDVEVAKQLDLETEATAKAK
jgi:hypothetical protein